MEELNNKKMWEYVIKHYRNHNPVYEGCKDIFDEALEEQGFEYKNEEIVEIEAEKEWCIALDNIGQYEDSVLGKRFLFFKGERVTKEKVFNAIPFMSEEEYKKYFRPATQEEINGEFEWNGEQYILNTKQE